MNWRVKLIIWIFGLFFAFTSFMSSSYPDYKGFYIALIIIMGLLIMTFWKSKPQFSEIDKQKALKDYEKYYSWERIKDRIFKKEK